MSQKLHNKTALVTGGSRGIGAAIARRLAADGADVAITYAGNKEAADATVAAIEAAGRKGLAIQADATDAQAVRGSIEQAVKALGHIDILIHNAGVAEMAPVGEQTHESYAKQFGVNVEGVFVGTSAAVPHIPDGGRIIIIGTSTRTTCLSRAARSMARPRRRWRALPAAGRATSARATSWST